MTGPDEEAIRAAPDAARAAEWSLVLASTGIAHRVVEDGAEHRVLVAAPDAPAACEALDAYERERRPAARPEPAAPELGRTTLGFVVAAFLVACYAITGPTSSGSRWHRAGRAAAERIAEGEVWRAVTALTLHTDAAHLLGNVVGVAVFVGALEREVGTGVAAWLVLLAGIVGNTANALLQGRPHSSIGASTAVFGAIGILGGLAFAHRRGTRRAWLPLAGSLALLAMLGTGQRADLGAHLFGLLAGVVLGAGVGLVAPRRAPSPVQWVCGLAAVATLAASWSVALR